MKWTEQEDAILAAAYAAGGINLARAALPYRTDGALSHRAQSMNVKSGSYTQTEEWSGEWCLPVQSSASVHRLWQACDVAMGGEPRMAA